MYVYSQWTDRADKSCSKIKVRQHTNARTARREQNRNNITHSEAECHPARGTSFFFALCERFTSFSILQSCTQKRRVASQRDLSPSSSGCCCRCLLLVVVVALINEEMFVDRALFFITAAAAAVAVCGGEKKNSYELLQQIPGSKPSQPTNRIGLLISPAHRRRLSVLLWSGTSSNSLAAASHHYCIAAAAVAVA